MLHVTHQNNDVLFLSFFFSNLCDVMGKGEGARFWSSGQPGDDLSCYAY